MVSLSVHVSCFDLYIVYTNMSGVTIKDNYNKYYVHQSILSILSFSKKPHHELTG